MIHPFRFLHRISVFKVSVFISLYHFSTKNTIIIDDFSLIFYLFGNFSNFQIDKKSTYRSEVQRNDSHDSDFFIIFKHHTKFRLKTKKRHYSLITSMPYCQYYPKRVLSFIKIPEYFGTLNLSANILHLHINI